MRQLAVVRSLFRDINHLIYNFNTLLFKLQSEFALNLLTSNFICECKEGRLPCPLYH